MGIITIKKEKFAQNWNKIYPIILNSWELNWTELTAFFEYPEEIRWINA